MIPSGSRILIVEDEYFTAQYLEAFLKREGFPVIGSTSEGAEAIKLSRERKPDIVIMDIRLAGTIDGIQTARTIREEGQAFIVFMTGYQDDALRAEAMAIGDCDYLVKPAKVSDIHRLFPRDQKAKS